MRTQREEVRPDGHFRGEICLLYVRGGEFDLLHR